MDEQTVQKRMERLDAKEKIIKDKIKALKTQLKEIDNKKKDLKNLEITRMIKSLKMPRDKLYDYLKKGTIPKESEVTDYEEM